MKPCKPRLKKLRNLLEKCSYKGSELEKEVLASNEMYTFEHLSAKIQASDDQLKEALKEMGAFQVDGNTNLNNSSDKIIYNKLRIIHFKHYLF